MPIKSISYGGGVQSSAMIVLAIEGKIDAEVALFANVGDDSEHPASLVYVREVMIPWAAERGFPVHELRRVMRTGEERTLWQQLMRDSRTIDIPVRMPSGAPGNRNCTKDYKMKVIGRWLRKHGASADDPATVHIGISTDEFHRANNKRAEKYEQPTYPLLDLGLDRQDCKNIIADAGLPVPPKSSCFFCPFHMPQQWAELRRDEPELFERSVELERTLQARRTKLGRDPVFLTGLGKPLDEAIGEAQDELPLVMPGDDGSCDSGHCFT